ncbi:MAG: hypothetical protein JW793_08370 [Acidobacteria bacterium]|nr:hypothetical protein [Acidobacteriota bacterium]
MALELMDLGYSKENIKVLEGGLIEWDAAGYPMIKEKDFINRKEVSTTGESHPISGIDV